MLRNKIATIFLLIALSSTGNAFSEINVITVNAGKKIGMVNSKVFGTNFLGYDPALHKPDSGHSYGYADYGAGAWNPRDKTSVSEVIALAKEIGISAVRFPGGCGAHHYNWKKTIGDNRKHYLYGLNEFLSTVDEIGAEAVIIISYFTGTAKDAAELVEYLNAPNNGDYPWAEKRARNGHPEPYNVKYFEFGNEVWHGDHIDRTMKNGRLAVMPEEYAERYLAYQSAMNKVDSSIQLGLILHPHGERWNNIVLDRVGSNVDYVDIHIYPPHDIGFYYSYKRFDAKDLFRVVLGSTHAYSDNSFERYSSMLEKTSGRDDVFFAVNEFNGGFVQDEPVPYRHSLGNALVIAELLKIFMHPSNKVLMAGYWQFSNSYWGMIRTDDNYMSHDYRQPITYRKRPNFYVYKLYNEHFGNILLDTSLKSETYDIGVYKPYMKKLNKLHNKGQTGIKDKILNSIKIFANKPNENKFIDTSIPYLSVNASKNLNGDKIFMIIVNKNMDDKMKCVIELKDFIADDKVLMWILNGPSVDSTNEKNETVKIEQKEILITGNPFEVYFEPHSVTAIEIRNRGVSQ